MAIDEEDRRDDLRQTVEKHHENLKESEENALAALKKGTETEEETHTVTLTGGIEVEVIDNIPGHLERKAASIQKTGDESENIDRMIEVMCHVIQSDGFDSTEVWRQYYEEYGSKNLAKCAMAVTDPWYEQQMEIEDQRQFRQER